MSVSSSENQRQGLYRAMNGTAGIRVHTIRSCLVCISDLLSHFTSIVFERKSDLCQSK
jgi:hypothetical protein